MKNRIKIRTGVWVFVLMIYLCGNLLFTLTIHAADAEPVLVKDIWPGPDSSLSKSNSININGLFYFCADSGTSGYELWRSNGTEAGTYMVKDINPSGDSYPDLFTKVNGTLYFIADTVTGREISKSDGTEKGTIVLSNGNVNPYALTVVNETIYFSGQTATGYELWKIDASGVTTILTNGTVMPNNLIAANNTLYFGGQTGTGYELWKIDTSGVTTILTNSNVNPSNITDVNDALYFNGYTGSGYELWKIDASGVTTILTNSDVNPINLTCINDMLYFNSGPYLLWKSDGTISGTTLVIEALQFDLSQKALVNGGWYVVASDGNSGFELWKSNANMTNVTLVKDIYPGSPGSYPRDLTDGNDVLFFFANDGEHGYELWKYDTSSSGENTGGGGGGGGCFIASADDIRLSHPLRRFIPLSVLMLLFLYVEYKKPMSNRTNKSYLKVK